MQMELSLSKEKPAEVQETKRFFPGWDSRTGLQESRRQGSFQEISPGKTEGQDIGIKKVRVIRVAQPAQHLGGTTAKACIEPIRDKRNPLTPHKQYLLPDPE